MNVGGVIGGRWLTTWTLTHRVLRAAQDKESSWFVTGRTGKLAADS